MKEGTIHINCDLGEGSRFDAELMPLISACNIACGGHAGNLETMHHTVALAMENNVEIGAHPSYPDKENFGRKSLVMEAEELKFSVFAQVLGLKQITEAEGAKLTHIKPHGALYNEATKDKRIAEIIIETLLEFKDDFVLYAPENSVISQLAKTRIEVVFEAFADRNYTTDYSLIPRFAPTALITKKEAVLEHLFSMFSEGKITCKNGQKISTNATTFCLHSDTPDAVEVLRYLHLRLNKRNIQVL